MRRLILASMLLFATTAFADENTNKANTSFGGVTGKIADAAAETYQTATNTVNGVLDDVTNTTGINAKGIIAQIASGDFSINSFLKNFGIDLGGMAASVIDDNLTKVLLENEKLTYDNGLLALSCTMPDLDFDLSKGFCSGRIAEAKNEVNKILAKLTEGFTFGSCTIGLSKGNKLCNETFIEKACKELENAGNTLKEGFKKGLSGEGFDMSKRENLVAMQENASPLNKILKAANEFLPTFKQTNDAKSNGDGCLLGTSGTEYDKQKTKDGSTSVGAEKIARQCIISNMLEKESASDKTAIARCLENADIPLSIASSADTSSCSNLLTAEVRKAATNAINWCRMNAVFTVVDSTQTQKNIHKAAAYLSEKSRSASYSRIKEVKTAANKAASECNNLSSASATEQKRCKLEKVTEQSKALKDSATVTEGTSMGYAAAIQGVTGLYNSFAEMAFESANNLNLNEMANEHEEGKYMDIVLMSNQMSATSYMDNKATIQADAITMLASTKLSTQIFEAADADLKRVTEQAKSE